MKTLVLVASVIVSAATTLARADTVFSDDFNSGASSAWSNTLGNWTAEGGVYRAQQPDNFPNTHSFVSALPSLTDFSVTVDVNAARDGGVWLRASSDPTTQVGVTGILLIFLNDGPESARPNALFWHDVGEQYGAQLNVAVDQYVGFFLSASTYRATRIPLS